MISNKKTGRSGFTLLELLVVLALMAMLLALVTGAVFRVLGEQREKNTGIHLHKIQMMLDQQWKAKTDQIRKEAPPAQVIEMTRNADGSVDMERAKAFHLKMRLRQEFPNDFGEVYSTGWFTAGSGERFNYDVKPYYRAALKSPYRSAPNTFTFTEYEQHSAALLVLILSQGAGGATTDPESIAPTKLMDFPQDAGVGVPAGSIQLRVFVDAFGQHIGFRRQADDSMADVITELSLPPFVGSGSPDPQDPSGRLQMPANRWGNYGTENGKVVATRYLARPGFANPFDGTNRGPFAFSSGKNKTFYTPDDLYSYRIQQAGKGN